MSVSGVTGTNPYALTQASQAQAQAAADPFAAFSTALAGATGTGGTSGPGAVNLSQLASQLQTFLVQLQGDISGGGATTAAAANATSAAGTTSTASTVADPTAGAVHHHHHHHHISGDDGDADPTSVAGIDTVTGASATTDAAGSSDSTSAGAGAASWLTQAFAAYSPATSLSLSSLGGLA